MVNIDINIVNMIMHSTVGSINRITDRVTSPVILTKTTFVIFIKFQITSFRYNTSFSGTDKTQTKNTDPRYKLFKNKSQSYQMCQVHNNNLNYCYFWINNHCNHRKKIVY